MNAVLDEMLAEISHAAGAGSPGAGNGRLPELRSPVHPNSAVSDLDEAVTGNVRRRRWIWCACVVFACCNMCVCVLQNAWVV